MSGAQLKIAQMILALNSFVVHFRPQQNTLEQKWGVGWSSSPMGRATTFRRSLGRETTQLMSNHLLLFSFLPLLLLIQLLSFLLNHLLFILLQE